ncbi:hypothetical protein [Sphingomonas sp.]|uniref:hypothetical protein n=1 Tax=Sphingomonas sp. TaxID=28214 RepID=UPI003D6CAF1A
MRRVRRSLGTIYCTNNPGRLTNPAVADLSGGGSQVQVNVQGAGAIIEIPPFVIALLILLFIVQFAVLGFFLIRGKMRRARSPVILRPGGSVEIPLVAAFGGWKGVPWISMTDSNLAPLLVLHQTDFEYRVIRLKRRPYTDISNVDLRTTIGTVNIVLEFHNSMRNFAGNTANKENARKALDILASKGCPLSARARAFVSGAHQI